MPLLLKLLAITMAGLHTATPHAAASMHMELLSPSHGAELSLAVADAIFSAKLRLSFDRDARGDWANCTVRGGGGGGGGAGEESAPGYGGGGESDAARCALCLLVNGSTVGCAPFFLDPLPPSPPNDIVSPPPSDAATRAPWVSIAKSVVVPVGALGPGPNWICFEVCAVGRRPGDARRTLAAAAPVKVYAAREDRQAALHSRRTGKSAQGPVAHDSGKSGGGGGGGRRSSYADARSNNNGMSPVVTAAAAAIDHAGLISELSRAAHAPNRPHIAHMSPAPAVTNTTAPASSSSSPSSSSSSYFSSSPPQPSSWSSWPSVTLVLTLTLRDMPRAMTLLMSLGAQMRCGEVETAARNDDGDDGDMEGTPPGPAGVDKAAQNSSVSSSADAGGGRGGRGVEDQARREPCWLKGLVVVVPDSEAFAFETLLLHRRRHPPDDPAEPARPVRVVAESALLGFAAPPRPGGGPAGGAPGPPSPLPSAAELGLPAGRWEGYAVQMALKLLAAAAHVDTDYYLTLDADLVCTRRFHPTDLFVPSPSLSGSCGTGGGGGGCGGGCGRTAAEVGAASKCCHRALCSAEGQAVHPHWWTGSAATLRYFQGTEDAAAAAEEGGEEEEEEGGGGSGSRGLAAGPWFVDPAARFGVTPALLSTGGAQLVLGRLKEVFGGNDEHGDEGAGGGLDGGAWVARWLASWGQPSAAAKEGEGGGGGDGPIPPLWWSEYTLYALVLHHRRLFDTLHAYRAQPPMSSASSFASSSSSSAVDAGVSSGQPLVPATELSCRSIWFAGDLPWDAAAAFRGNTKDTSPVPAPTGGGGSGEGEGRCPFAVVQSSSGADPSALAAAVAGELRRLLQPYVTSDGTCCEFGAIFDD